MAPVQSTPRQEDRVERRSMLTCVVLISLLFAAPSWAQEPVNPGARMVTGEGCTAAAAHDLVSAGVASHSAIAVDRIVELEGGDEVVVSTLDGQTCAGRLFATARDRSAVRTNGLVTSVLLADVRAVRRHQPSASIMRRSVWIGAVAGGAALGAMCMAAGAAAGDDLAEPTLKCAAAGAAAGASVGAIVALVQNAVGRYAPLFERRPGSRPTRSVDIVPAVGPSAARLQISLGF